MAKSLTEMAAEIIAAQASHSAMTAEEMSDALLKIFSSLKGIKCKEDYDTSGQTVSSEPSDSLSQLQTSPHKSIQRNKVICLECGKEFKQLTNRHLTEHGITTKEYRKKWGFGTRQPLSAKSLTAKRRKNAQDRNLGEMLKAARLQKGK